MNAASAPFPPPLTAAEFAALQRLTRWMGHWGHSRRRRRLLFVALAAPGFFAVFATPLHHSFAALLAGLLLFAAACAFRGLTEPLFLRAEAAALWPPLPDPRYPETSDD
jgi:hypothetical protein